MKENATRCFFTACLVIAVAALGTKSWNLYSSSPLRLTLAAMQTEQDKQIEIIQKRLQYAKTCVLEEKVLDNIYGPVQHNCEKIAAQVYPFPEKLKQI